jgi:hypothetical protein
LVTVTVTATEAGENPLALSAIVALPPPVAVTTNVSGVLPGPTLATALFDDAALTDAPVDTLTVCVWPTAVSVIAAGDAPSDVPGDESGAGMPLGPLEPPALPPPPPPQPAAPTTTANMNGSANARNPKLIKKTAAYEAAQTSRPGRRMC